MAFDSKHDLSDLSDMNTEEPDFDVLLQAELREALEQERGESTDDGENDGPDDESGELPEDPEDAEDNLEDEESDEDEDEEGDESEDEDKESESKEKKPEESKDEPQESKELAALREELALSRRERDEARAERKELIALFQRQQEPPGGNRELPADTQFQAAWEAAFLNKSDAFQRFPPEVQDRVRDLSERYNRDQARYALDPKAELFEKFGPTLKSIFEQELAPVREFIQRAQEQNAVQPFREELADEAVKQRVVEILVQDIPGHEVQDPAFQQQRIKAALKQYRLEQAASKTSQREQKLQTRERQQEAKKRSARKGTSAGKRSRQNNNRRERPQLDNPEDMKSFADALMADEELLRELEQE